MKGRFLLFYVLAPEFLETFEHALVWHGFQPTEDEIGMIRRKISSIRNDQKFHELRDLHYICPISNKKIYDNEFTYYNDV